MAVTITHTTVAVNGDHPTDPTILGQTAWNEAHTVNGLGTMAEATAANYSTTAQIAAAYQPLDADLTAISGLTSAANKIAYYTGAATAALADFTAAGRAMVAAASAAAQTALLDAFVGDSGSGGTKGLVPAPTTGDGSKFLKGDGTWTAIPGGGDALVANPLSQFALTTSLQLKGVISDETGNGQLVFADTPTLVTPVIGAATGTSLVLSSGTGLTVGASIPFSDAAGTLTLQNVDALDATTEATIEAAIDTLASLGSIQGVAFTFGAYAATLLNNANEAAFKAAVNAEAGVDFQAYDADLASWAGVTRAAGFDTFAATPSSANLRSLLTDETGSGVAYFQGGDAGTPSAIVLTNGTGLPVSSGISGLGSGVGTFLATPSYANLAAAVTGSVLKTAGAETIWIPAGSMKPRNTNGAGQSTYDSGATADLAIDTVDFDTTTQEYAHTLPIGMPKSWDESTITAVFYWTNTAGASTQTVRWSIAGLARSDDDALDTAFGTAQTVDDTWLAQNDLHISAATSAVTIGGTPAENDQVIFEITRVVASDNMAGDAKLIGVKIIITTNATNDA